MGKCGPVKTLYLDNFHAVYTSVGRSNSLVLIPYHLSLILSSTKYLTIGTPLRGILFLADSFCTEKGNIELL